MAVNLTLPPWKDFTSGQQKFPALAGWRSSPQEFALIRSLTNGEEELARRFAATYDLIERRMNLLHIVGRNFNELERFLSTHSAEVRFESDSRLECDRLILNYLSSGYGLYEQFKGHVGKNSPKTVAHFKAFIKDLETRHFAFAFFRDFRNYAQHCELPVGRIIIHRTRATTTVQIRHLIEDLLLEYKHWEKSGLKRLSGEIDLVQLLREYNSILLGEFGAYVAKHFLPEVLPIHNFVNRLRNEVKEVNPTYDFLICTSASGDWVTKADFTCSILPQDILASLRIALTPRI